MNTVTSTIKAIPPRVDVQVYSRRLQAEMLHDAERQAAAVSLSLKAINSIYSDLGLKEPIIIRVESMIQFCNMPWLTSLLCQTQEPKSRSELVKRFKAIKSTQRNSMIMKLGDKFLDHANLDLPASLGPLLNTRLVQTLVKDLSTALAAETVALIGEEQKLDVELTIRWFVFRRIDRLRNSPAIWGQSAAYKGLSRSANVYSLPGDIQTKAEAVAQYQGEQSQTPSMRLAPHTVFANAWSASDLYWLTTYDYLRSGLDFSFEPRIDKQLNDWMALLRSGFAYMFFENVCFVYAHPERMTLDDRLRLHNETEAAFIGADGEKHFYWHGTNINERLIKFRKLITPMIIDMQPNTERRRVMIEMYGWDRYLRKTKSLKIHQDETGSLYRKDFKRGEPAVFVEVTNQTPEPDGSSKKYLLRVPPTMTTARAAVAWTFGLEADEYVPEIES